LDIKRASFEIELGDVVSGTIGSDTPKGFRVRESLPHHIHNYWIGWQKDFMGTTMGQLISFKKNNAFRQLTNKVSIATEESKWRTRQ